MNLKKCLITIFYITINSFCVSGYATEYHQLADTAFFGLEQKLQEVHLDFNTAMQLSFDPFLLEQPKNDALSIIKRMWHQLDSKARARIACGKDQQAVGIVDIMQQVVNAVQHVQQKVQLLALGSDKTPYAAIKKGLSFRQQQAVTLAALLPIVALVTKALKVEEPKELSISSDMIAQFVIDAYRQQLFSPWSFASIQPVSALLMVDLSGDYSAVTQRYYACLCDYAKLFTSAIDVTDQFAMNKQMLALGEKLKEALGHLEHMKLATTDDARQRVFSYMTNHLEIILPEVESLTICTTFTEPMLAELFALHFAVQDSPGFALVQEKIPELAENYVKLTDTFFKHQPNNPLFFHQLHKTMQAVKFQANAKKTHVPVGIVDYIKMFWRVIHVILISTSKDPLLDTLDHMHIVLRACSEWHSSDRKQAKTLIEWLIPKGVLAHPMLQPLLQNNNVLTHIAAAGAIPLGAKAIRLVKGLFDGRQADATLQQEALNPELAQLGHWFQLAKDNPVMFKELVKHDPKILETLAAHYAPTDRQAVGASA
jgi:hypothetical protein